MGENNYFIYFSLVVVVNVLMIQESRMNLPCLQKKKKFKDRSWFVL